MTIKIKFSQVELNSKFTDQESNAPWKKIDSNLAVLLSTGNHGIMGMVDEFGDDEIVLQD
jgi:hypothetical protein